MRLNALCRWHIVPSAHSTNLEINSVAPVNIDYLPAKYFLEKDFHFRIPSREAIAFPKVLNICSDGCKLNRGFEAVDCPRQTTQRQTS